MGAGGYHHEAKLAAIEQRKTEALEALQAQRSKLKAKLAQLDRPTKSRRRLGLGLVLVLEGDIERGVGEGGSWGRGGEGESLEHRDARRKILLGALVLEQMQKSGITPQTLNFQGERFFDWLVKPNDQAPPSARG